MTELEQLLIGPRPSSRQLRWQAREFYAFLHFGINTMTGREWGTGQEDPALFDPQDFDADQWMAALASAGMTGAIITAKHHDGFCLWPSAHTRHSVASSPWRGGRGDVVGELAAAAARQGLGLGIYLSPWDRADARYGSGAAYDDYLVDQLTELLTHYGPVFSVWFDGANGEGPNGVVQTYDWDRYYATVRELQPDAVINVCGPDVRWCGNEAGHFRRDEWSVVPRQLQEIERIADKSQHTEQDTAMRQMSSEDEDLGSRTALAGHEHDLVWYPAEVNTSIRPGWFYHPEEDSAVRSVEELETIYRGSVGGNATFLLNVPADARGLIADPDLVTLRELGRRIGRIHERQLPASVRWSSGGLSDPSQTEQSAELWGASPHPADRQPAVIQPASLALTNGTGWWQPAEADPRPTLTLQLDTPTMVDTVICKEEISRSQRIEHLEVHGRRGDQVVVLAETSSVGYQRILSFPATEVQAVEIVITASRSVPLLAGVAVLAAE